MRYDVWPHTTWDTSFLNRQTGNRLVSSPDCGRMSKILRIMNAGKERWQGEILTWNEARRVGGENWRLIIPTVSQIGSYEGKERYSLLETYSLLLLFSLVIPQKPIAPHSWVKEQLISKAHSKTQTWQLIRLRNVRLPTEVCISKWELALSRSLAFSLLALTSVFVFYRGNFRRFGKFMNFSRVSVRLRKLLYVKSWIGHWEILRSFRRNYSSGTAVVGWTFAKFDNYFYTSNA